MKDLIILAGTPGSGKSTLCRLLREELHSPYIDFGWMREWHLSPDWSNQSPEEREMAFENLVFILKNYLKHGYKNILVTDFGDGHVELLTKIFSDNDVIVVSLILNDDEELKRRVLSERASGFKNFEAAIAWNRMARERPDFKNEYKIDNTSSDPQKTAREILRLLQ